jgi:hypothetical protein
MPPDSVRRKALLKQLQRINEALERRGAVLDITTEEAESIREVRTLEHLVDATARRLAMLVDLLR